LGGDPAQRAIQRNAILSIRILFAGFCPGQARFVSRSRREEHNHHEERAQRLPQLMGKPDSREDDSPYRQNRGRTSATSLTIKEISDQEKALDTLITHRIVEMEAKKKAFFRTTK